MILAAVILILAAIGAVVMFMKGSKRPPKSRLASPMVTIVNQQGHADWRTAARNPSYALPITQQMQSDEEQDQDEIFRLLEERMRASNVFLPAKIADVIRTLRSGSDLFGRTNSKPAFKGEIVLTVPEKKALGLNTRMKYTTAFIDNFDLSKISVIEPKSFLENMHLAVAHKVRSQRELKKLRSSSLISKVEVVPCDDARDCGRVKTAKRIYAIADVPDLPLKGCDAPYCRCSYLAVIS